tara:strand:+ start:45 stop:338 length:294 start_codon:yes stop_codon:yes gene_type:complete
METKLARHLKPGDKFRRYQIVRTTMDLFNPGAGFKHQKGHIGGVVEKVEWESIDSIKFTFVEGTDFLRNFKNPRQREALEYRVGWERLQPNDEVQVY